MTKRTLITDKPTNEPVTELETSHFSPVTEYSNIPGIFLTSKHKIRSTTTGTNISTIEPTSYILNTTPITKSTKKITQKTTVTESSKKTSDASSIISTKQTKNTIYELSTSTKSITSKITTKKNFLSKHSKIVGAKSLNKTISIPNHKVILTTEETKSFDNQIKIIGVAFPVIIISIIISILIIKYKFMLKAATETIHPEYTIKEENTV